MLNKEEKSNIIAKFAKSANDTGSSEVQIALISKRISQLSGHLQKFPKDNHSRRGLLCMLGRRKAFLKYLERTDFKSYSAISQSMKELV